MNKSDITSLLATRLKEARADRGLSLDAVAKLSGVSRSMVSQIERGTSSPTVATLWNLTNALGVDFAVLLDEADPTAAGIETLTAAETPQIDSQGSGVRIRILSPPQDAGEHEVYELRFAKGGALESAPHSPGARELLTVFAGQLKVTSGSSTTVLNAGDTARYAADTEHSIRAGDTESRACLIVRYSG